VVDRFLQSEAFVCGVKGPIGSGKSTACVMKILQIAQRQPTAPDGKRHSRFVVIRNTYGELDTTTIKTWHQWIPQSIGHWQSKGPPTHHITTEDFDMEVMFVALDRPDDVRKLLSMELTGAWINEAREIPKAIVDGLTGRVNRYPPKSWGGCNGPQILMDTNPPELHHWWHIIAERDRSTTTNNKIIDSVEMAETELRKAGVLDADKPLFEFFSQPSGLSPDAENISNLNGGRAYYIRASAGKSEEWVKVYVHGEYGFVQDGLPVFTEYRDSVHSKDFEINPQLPLFVGIDFGLTPAAVIGQRYLNGQIRIRHEITTESMGAKRFGQLLADFLKRRYPMGMIEAITGDPAGEQRSQTDEETPYDMLLLSGIKAKPAHTNDFTLRREAVAKHLSDLIDGEPGLIVHPECAQLRRALSGAYRYKRVQVSGDDRYHEQPEKNMASHVAEALQYALLGVGSAKILLKGRMRETRSMPQYAIT
jgi:hypothetical protein